MEYDIICSFDLSDAVKEVGEIAKSVNTALAMSGIDETACIKSSLDIGTMTVTRKLTRKEEDTITNMLAKELHKKVLPYKHLTVSLCSKSSDKSPKSPPESQKA